MTTWAGTVAAAPGASPAGRGEPGMPETRPIEPRRFRDVMGHVPTGVALVTGMTESGEPLGMVVGSFTSVSLEPPLVAYFPMKSSTTFARLRTLENFAVNVLASDQQDLCRAFTSRREDRWRNLSWHRSPSGCPVLDDAIAWVDCRVVAVQEAGDHYMVLGEVTDLSDRRPAPPLLFFQGDYATLRLDGGAPPGASAAEAN